MATTWTEMQKLQPRVMKLLQNSIERNRLAHAYLFEGRKGTGKLDAATLLAKSFFALKMEQSHVSHAGTASGLNLETIRTYTSSIRTAFPLKRDKSRRFRKSFLRPVWNRIKSCILFPMRIK